MVLRGRPLPPELAERVDEQVAERRDRLLALADGARELGVETPGFEAKIAAQLRGILDLRQGLLGAPRGGGEPTPEAEGSKGSNGTKTGGLANGGKDEV